MLMLVVSILCLGLASQGVLGTETGAPTSVCATMTPAHGQKGTGDGGYKITTDQIIYAAGGDVIEVTLEGDNFQGFLMQARKAGTNTNVGTFSTPTDTKSKTIKCGHNDGAWTHAHIYNRTSVSTTWTPPAKLDGKIEFVATVAKSYEEYYLNVKSSKITSGASTITGWTFAVIVTVLMSLTNAIH